MKRSTKFAYALVASIGLTAVAVPAAAQQTQKQHGAGMGAGMSMMGGHGAMGSMMGDHGGMGSMMGGAFRHAMEKFDSDKDGTLSPEEMTAGIQTELKTYDTDANGALSLEEFAVMHAAHTRPMTVRAFQMHDPDGDAQVTEAEMSAMAAQMQSHMSGKQNGERDGNQGMMKKN